MDNTYLDIYNNLIKLTRNKELYNLNKQDTFYERMIIFFFHLAFLLKINKKTENKQNLQNFFDYCIRQIELSIREIGYGDATINKKMKEYVNLLFSIIDNIDLWETKNFKEKKKILNSYIQDMSNDEFFINYLEKYSKFLSKNTFNKLTKDIITF
mgnify:CR=1 FL=1|tara:strand:- start:558 stop:1022 length:465 start_codon:yes stop_codon:yes gene_type:complete